MISLKKNNKTWIPRVLLFFLTSIFFFPSIKELFVQWFTTGSYYTQGPFVCIVFFWILLKRYRSSKSNPGNSYRIGFVLISLALLIDIFGRYASVVTFQFFSIYIFIIGSSFFFLGINFVYRNMALFIYLLLAIPLPGFILDYATFNLKLAAASVSGFFLSYIYDCSMIRLSRIVNPRKVEEGEILLREFAEKETPLIFKNLFNDMSPVQY